MYLKNKNINNRSCGAHEQRKEKQANSRMNFFQTLEGRVKKFTRVFSKEKLARV